MVVGWMVAGREDAILAELSDACQREGIAPQPLTIHADRGAPMRSQVLTDRFADLGSMASQSRPSVSDDTPSSEAQFKTMTYHPTDPDRFASRAAARAWVATFLHGSATEHRHTGIGLVSPIVVHTGQAAAVTAVGQTTLDAAYVAHPERVVHRQPTAPVVSTMTWINEPSAPVNTIPNETSCVPRICLKPIDTFRLAHRSYGDHGVTMRSSVYGRSMRHFRNLSLTCDSVGACDVPPLFAYINSSITASKAAREGRSALSGKCASGVSTIFITSGRVGRS
jgi:hypothetical protein